MAKVETMGEDLKERGKARLIMPQWDIPPIRPIHPSQDLLSMMHLDTLYDIYVQPLTGDTQPGTGIAGEGLCPINPQSIQKEWYQRARLEVGLVQDGYIRGEKAGVREAEEKRRRKRVARINSAADSTTADASFSPFPFSNANSGSSAPGNPAIPVAPTQRGYP
ncbi:uncharacterized protein L203_100703 [Cryptococcus depauperatus CBS 7841]|uniref:Uncharacterized protein n=1 Tax=Cryptococcus depauperatus CBS 7841 TaxID=1295531 RepID=A0AAJ8LWK2_9TREE